MKPVNHSTSKHACLTHTPRRATYQSSVQISQPLHFFWNICTLYFIPTNNLFGLNTLQMNGLFDPATNYKESHTLCTSWLNMQVPASGCFFDKVKNKTTENNNIMTSHYNGGLTEGLILAGMLRPESLFMATG